MSIKSPMVRLAPLQFTELPPHPEFNKAETVSTRPDLLTFTLAILDQGRSLVLPTNFNLEFKSHSWKPSPPSNNEVEILSNEVSSSDIQSLSWSTQTNPRPKPTKIRDEYWYARRSYHHNLSVKHNSPGSASFEEFIFGLRDNKSQREKEFTTDLYDAHYICDWNEQVNSLFSEFKRPSPSSSDAPTPGATAPAQTYTNLTMTLHEMCHKLPSPAAPRCFPTLVLTASVSPSEFITISLPVDMSDFPLAFYSTKRNHKEGSDHQQRKSVTLGNYVAVERVHKYPSVREHVKDSKSGKEMGREGVRGDSIEEEIEWVMATASHAKGSIPMAMQRMGVPGAIAKDVGLFLKWIGKVPREDVGSVVVGENSDVAAAGATASAVEAGGETSRG